MGQITTYLAVSSSCLDEDLEAAFDVGADQVAGLFALLPLTRIPNIAFPSHDDLGRAAALYVRANPPTPQIGGERAPVAGPRERIDDQLPKLGQILDQHPDSGLALAQ